MCAGTARSASVIAKASSSDTPVFRLPFSREHYIRYGTAHRRLRKQWARKVERGDVECWRCGKVIDPRDAWDLDHVDGGGPMDYYGPSHARCNRATNRRSPEPPPWDPNSRIW